MSRVKTFVNGGSLLPGDLNSIQDDYEFAFSTYRSVVEREGQLGSSAPAGVYPLTIGTGSMSVVGAGPSTVQGFWLDPADVTANGRVAKLRLRAVLNTSTTAPAQTLTLGLLPITSTGTGPNIASVGSFVTGSTVAFTTPAGSSSFQGVSGDFTTPTAGFYALCLNVPGTTAASSIVQMVGQLQTRMV